MSATHDVDRRVDRRVGRTDLVRWLAGHTLYGVPMAAAPIAFGLLGLQVTGSAAAGAAMVLAMTTASVLGAVPVSRLGRRVDRVTYLRLLLVTRTVALAALTGLAAADAPLSALLAAATLAGLVNASAYGYLRLLLNGLVGKDGLPRALGVAATLTEVTFATSPLLASLVGAASPVAAMTLVTVLGALPAALVPRVAGAQPDPSDASPVAGGSEERLPAAVYLWLACAAIGGGAVAAVEVGAVSFALDFDLGAAWAFVFALALCVGSVTGGIWVSVRNRVPSPWRVVGLFVMTSAGMGAVVADQGLALTLAGAGVIGFFLPMLATYYSLVLDELSPARRRAEVFALLRTASAVGVIAVSGTLALLGLRAAVLGSFAGLLLAVALVTLRAALATRAVPGA